MSFRESAGARFIADIRQSLKDKDDTPRQKKTGHGRPDRR